MFEIETKDKWTAEEWDAEDARLKALQNSRARDAAVKKSIKRHAQKGAKVTPVPFGMGMGWEPKDVIEERAFQEQQLQK